MTEYISRSSALQAVGDVHPLDYNGQGIVKRIKRIPAADVVEVRHGRWMWDGGEDMHYHCSRCHHNTYGCTTEILDGKYRYCPSCGAVMDGGQDDV